VHTSLWQSESAAHVEPAEQGAQAPPPQSMSVSVPSDAPSLQLAARQTPLSHRREAQSAFDLQARFVPQGAQSAPPQSWSVSSASI
jgi:hypothetical protein